MSTKIAADVTKLGSLAKALDGLSQQVAALQGDLATAVRPALRGDVPELGAIQAGAAAARASITRLSSGLSNQSSAVRAYGGNLARIEALAAQYRRTLFLQAFGPMAMSPFGFGATVGGQAGLASRATTQEQRAALAALGLSPDDRLPADLVASFAAAGARLNALAASPLGRDALHLARTGEFTRTAQQGFERTYGVGASGVHQVGRVPIRMSATAQARGQVSASQSFTISSKGLAAAAEAGAMAEVSTKAEAKVGNRYIGAGAEANARAEAGARGNAEASIGRGGVTAAAHAEAGVSVSAGASARGNLSGVGAGVNGEVHAGLMASADVEGSASFKRIEARVEIGAALGLGGKVGFDVDVKPAQVVGDVKDGAGKAVKVANSWRKKIDMPDMDMPDLSW